MTHWHSLYLSSENRRDILTTIEAYFKATGYERYHPFNALPGKSYPLTLKLFIAPSTEGWTRILADGKNNTDDMTALLGELATYADVLSVSLDGNHSRLHGYRDGALITLAQWCEAHSAYSEDDFIALLESDQLELPPDTSTHVGAVPLHALPEDIQQMARDINANTANKMFKKLSDKLRKTIGFQNSSQLLNTHPNWDSQGGQLIRAIMAKLTLPDTWQTPDFVQVRSAYTIRTRQEQGIGIFVDDANVLTTVPNSLDYQPIYGGKFAL